MTMVTAFVLAALVCVPKTDVCAPDKSQLTGTIGDYGGQVTITPAGPMKALGAELAAGTPVVVTVLPWGSSDGTRGAVVHVAGQLAHEQVLSGVRVAGKVELGQIQGKPGHPQLVAADDLRGGKLDLFGHVVDIAPGMKLSGRVDIGGGVLDLTSPTPFTAFDLALAAGKLHVEAHQEGPTVLATLARPQQIGGVLVEDQVNVTFAADHIIWRSAKLAAAAPLGKLGLPDGEAPAGTQVFSGRVDEVRLRPPAAVTVCGVALLAQPGVGGVRDLVFSLDLSTKGFTLYGKLAASDVDVGDGIHMTGDISLRLAAHGCTRFGIEGKLARPAEHLGLHFAGKTTLALHDDRGTPFVRGTLAAPTTIDGFTVAGEVALHAPAAGLHLDTGKLTKPGVIEAWAVPAGTKLERFAPGWSFTVPPGTVAHARGEFHGHTIDAVTEARSDPSSTHFTLAAPFTPKGSHLAFTNLALDATSDCIVGGFAKPQHAGVFGIPKDGSATVCAGAIETAQGSYAIASLAVGSWFATEAVAGTRDIAPGQATPTGPPAGYWIQINSQCQAQGGIPMPPPAQHWIWVDVHGLPSTAEDREILTAQAAKPGSPCPVTPCCPP